MSDISSKLVSAEQALQCVQSGHRVYIHQGCSQPRALVEALVARAPALRDVEIVHLATMGEADYTRPEFEGCFRHNAFFVGPNARAAVQEGRADYIPIFLSEIEELFESGAMPLDVALLMCSPPDKHGYMSLGPGVDISLTAARRASRLIVQINDRCPRTYGDSFLHVSEATMLVEHSGPLAEYPRRAPTQEQQAIAKHIAALIPNGATLQTGIGGIPDAVLGFLVNHRHLGVHTEMFSDGIMELLSNGAIDNTRKTLHRGKVIAGFLLGTAPLFDFVHENPVFEFHPTRYTNDPFLIARNDRMVAINSALEVDLTGQVCADSLGSVPYSGVGGQVDFIRGAARSRGGLPIIALPSTARKGTLSRIVPRLNPGAGVVTSRADVHYVATEFGVAYLHGKNLRQRAEALIAIAHPKFQEDLEREAGRIFARPFEPCAV
jgi:acyl-CoA hydrolase